MVKSRKQENIENISHALSERNNPETAIEFKILCCIARVPESEAWVAINHLIRKGMTIRLTDGLPHKIYCTDG